MTLRIDSGSSCSPSSVEPVTSQNTDGDGLADLGSLGDVETRAADRAEVRSLGVLRPAVRTGRHGRSLGPLGRADEPLVRNAEAKP